MSITKTYLGDDEHGVAQFNYSSDSENPAFVLTGPTASGTVVLKDGTRYDVTDAVIEVAHDEHAAEVADLIEAQLRDNGLHPEQLAATTTTTEV